MKVENKFFILGLFCSIMSFIFKNDSIAIMATTVLCTSIILQEIKKNNV